MISIATPKTPAQIFNRLTNVERVTLIRASAQPGLLESFSHGIKHELAYAGANGEVQSFFDAVKERDVSDEALALTKELCKLVTDQFIAQSAVPGFPGF